MKWGQEPIFDLSCGMTGLGVAGVRHDIQALAGGGAGVGVSDWLLSPTLFGYAQDILVFTLESSTFGKSLSPRQTRIVGHPTG